jgi:hypothetical protein
MPDNKFKILWNIIIIFLLLYTATFVPYRVAFIDSDDKWLTVLDTFTDCLFGFDILVNLLSALEREDRSIETNFKVIARSYLSFWFWLDILAVMPF